MMTSDDKVGGWVKKGQNHDDVIFEWSLTEVSQCLEYLGYIILTNPRNMVVNCVWKRRQWRLFERDWIGWIFLSWLNGRLFIYKVIYYWVLSTFRLNLCKGCVSLNSLTICIRVYKVPPFEQIGMVEGNLNPWLFNPKLQPRTFQPQTFQPWIFEPWGWKVHGWKVWGWKVRGWKVRGWNVLSLLA